MDTEKLLEAALVAINAVRAIGIDGPELSAVLKTAAATVEQETSVKVTNHVLENTFDNNRR